MNYLDKTQRFWKYWNKLNSIYADYAKNEGQTYMSLLVLNILNMESENGCTQKYLVEQTFFSKQTINHIITTYYKQGIVELRENQNNRREKIVCLTDMGKEYAGTILPPLDHALDTAMQQFSEEEQQLLFSLMERYVDTCSKNVFKREIPEK